MSESSGESGDELSELERTGAAVAFRRSVVDRAKNAAKNDPGLSTNDRIRLFTYQRLLDRLFTESSAGSDMWVLKGATSLLCRYLVARSSKDIDLATRESLDVAEETLKSALRKDVGDHLNFQIRTVTEFERRSEGRRIALSVTCAGTELSAFHIDLIASIPFPEHLDYVTPKQPIALDGLEIIPYPSWPLVNAVADKVAATFELYDGRHSTRYRDLVDLFLLRRHGEFDLVKLRTAVHTEFDRRHLRLPTEFSVPDRSAWERGWGKIARGDAPFLAEVLFDEALTAIREFLHPVFASEAEGQWDMENGRWVLD